MLRVLAATAVFLIAVALCNATVGQERTRSVFFGDGSGEYRAFPRKTGPAPLTDLIRAFFDGPTQAEREAGAVPFDYGCVLADLDDTPPRSPCGFSDIVSRITVQGGRALIEVKAYPNASASGIWEALDEPLNRIVRQFPNVKSWAFVMRGYEISGGEYGSPCGNRVCFLFSDRPPSDNEAAEELSGYGVKRLEGR